MCGIAGFFDPGCASEEATAVLTAMADSIARRGPDGRGTVWEDGVGLAHTRLAIIDLHESGSQPMRSADGRWVIVFNGEIYNFRELRSDLTARGCSFRGTSDTEVLITAIAEWGIQAALERTAGMFAFAAFDRHRRELWLARDRAGEKPLYYTFDDRRLLFGSTIAALEAHPKFERRVCREAVAGLMQRGFVPSPLSIYANTWKVLPAQLLCFKLSAHPLQCSEQRYWALNAAARSVAAETTLSGLHDLLEHVVSEQMVSDRPLGSFLSGGIDSSLITAIMKSVSRQAVSTFTIGFREQAFDEAQHARAIAEHLGTQHTEVYLDADDALAFIDKLPQVYDEPFADSSQLPTLLVSEVARRKVVVALSGDGGDEVFGGYDRYLYTIDRWRRLSRWPLILRGSAGRVMAAAGRFGAVDRWLPALMGFARIRDSRRSAASALRYWGRYLAAPDLAALYGRTLRLWHDTEQVVPGARSDTRLRTGHDSSSGPMRRLMQWDIESYLPDDILVKVDRASMYHGLEVRAPLLDRRVMEFAWSLPESILTQDGRGKYPLRALLARHVPERLFERPKQGFAVPLGAWLRGPLLSRAEKHLEQHALEATGLFDSGLVLKRWRQHRDGIWDNSGSLWPVLAFMEWWNDRGQPAVAGNEEDAAPHVTQSLCRPALQTQGSRA